MCRLSAYLGPAIKLQYFLIDPPHSLYRQSWAAKEMQDTTVNADGFGFAWKDSEEQILNYKSILPIWSDDNLAALGTALKSKLWLANVRSATPGQPASRLNIQPFIEDKIIYLHNGFIKPFSVDIKTILLRLLGDQGRAKINGNTDSEYLFALIVQLYNEHHHMIDAIKIALQLISKHCQNTSMMLNIIIYFKQSFYACRYAVNACCPSLYYTTQDQYFPNAVIFSSERLSECNSWKTVPANTLIIARSNGQTAMHTLL